MRRMVAAGMLLALAMGLTGCDGGDEMGVPSDLTPATPIVDISKKKEMMKIEQKASKKSSSTMLKK